MLHLQLPKFQLTFLLRIQRLIEWQLTSFRNTYVCMSRLSSCSSIDHNWSMVDYIVPLHRRPFIDFWYWPPSSWRICKVFYGWNTATSRGPNLTRGCSWGQMITPCQAWSSFLGSNWPGLSDLHGAFMTCVVGLSTNQLPLQSHMVSRIFDASLDHRRRDFKVVAKRGNMVVLNGSKRVQ